MTPRTLLLLAASVIIGAASMSATATDAFAKKRGKATAPVVASAVVVAPDNGPPADHIPRCIDSVIFYPAPPCY